MTHENDARAYHRTFNDAETEGFAGKCSQCGQPDKSYSAPIRGGADETHDDPPVEGGYRGAHVPKVLADGCPDTIITSLERFIARQQR